MKKNCYIMLSVVSTFICSCKKNTSDPLPTEPIVIQNPTNSSSDVEVSGKITQNTTWESSKRYLLKGFVYVEENATLTILPGTIIRGDMQTKGTLIIKPGAKIMAAGTKDQPIIFTSSRPKGLRNPGDWGGLVILGKAKVNKSKPILDGENISTFGGNNDEDNSGILKFVRIEFGGIAYSKNKEINGLTLGGVGRGTEIDYVMVSYCGDDAFEFFGGTVNAKHLISYRNLDDDFDTDLGYRGKIQYAYVFRDPQFADLCTCSDSNGIELDNDGTGSNDTPQTSPTFTNLTIVMGEGRSDENFHAGIQLRNNASIAVYNSVIIGEFNEAGVEVDGVLSRKNFIENKAIFKGFVLTGMPTFFKISNETGKAVETLEDIGKFKKDNFIGIKLADIGMPDGYDAMFAKPATLPISSSMLLKNNYTTPSDIEQNTYIGAFDKVDWTEGWVNWKPLESNYGPQRMN